MAETFGASGAITATGAARPPLSGVFVETLEEEKPDESGWGVEGIWGGKARKPMAEYPSLDSEQIVEELRGRP